MVLPPGKYFILPIVLQSISHFTRQEACIRHIVLHLIHCGKFSASMYIVLCATKGGRIVAQRLHIR